MFVKGARGEHTCLDWLNKQALTGQATRSGSHPALCWLVTTARSNMQQDTWVPWVPPPGRVAKGALGLAVLSAAHRLLI